MQNIKFYRVTDGNNVVGSFRTRKAARYYLANALIFTSGAWKPMSEDGFRVERLNSFGEWTREGRP